MGYLLRIPADDMAVIRDTIDFFGYRDAVFEALLAAIGFTGREGTGDLLWPEAYAPLHARCPRQRRPMRRH